MLLEVFLAEELPQAGHAVYAPGLAFVAAVELRQAKVATAAQAGVRQQTQVAEAVLQEGSLLRKRQAAVCAFEEAAALPALMPRERLRGAVIASASFAFEARRVHV